MAPTENGLQKKAHFRKYVPGAWESMQSPNLTLPNGSPGLPLLWRVEMRAAQGTISKREHEFGGNFNTPK
jgi:hypothetical protein